MARRVGIIGGTGFYRFGKGETVEVETAHGSVDVDHHRVGAHDVFFLPRHGRDHERPAHRVNHKANVAALQASRVEQVFAVFNVGALANDLAAGSWLVPDDVLEVGLSRATFHDGEAVHVDFDEPFCPQGRLALVASAPKGARSSGVYASTPGPRFESAAERRMLSSLGAHVVGMTGGPEATLAREAGLCYSGLCFVANPAPSPGGVLDARVVQDGLAARRKGVVAWLTKAIGALPARRTCKCLARGSAKRLEGENR